MRQPGRADGTRRATIHDVARAANVSTATVSRALRYPEQVSTPLAARVEAAVAKLAYVPDASARALATARTQTAAIVTADLGRYAAIISSACRRLGGAGLATRLVECPTGGVDQAVEALAEGDMEGAIFVGVEPTATAASRLRARRIPMIVATAGHAEIPGVNIDLATSASVVIDHLATLGHRAMAVAGEHGADMLEAAWVAAVGEALHRRSAEQPMDLGKVTALLFASDAAAASAMKELRRAGGSVPEEVSIVGFGDAPWARCLDPGLASVRLPWHTIGMQLAEALVTARNGGKPQSVAVVPKLVVRGSVVPCST